MPEPIQGLWVGPRLGTMERLSIASFLAHGHPYHLYVYEEVAGLPAGAEMRDANGILPAADVFRHEEGPQRGSPGGFSDRFRYKLLLDRGGWWCDTDVVCLRPFAFGTPHVLCGERRRGLVRRVVNGGILRAPAGSPLLRTCYEAATAAGRTFRWGTIGPRLLTRAVYLRWIPGELLRLRNPFAALQPPRVFQPVDWWRVDDVVRAGARFDLADASAVHLWNEMWRQHGIDKEAVHPADCLYERLKSRYGIAPDSGRGAQ